MTNYSIIQKRSIWLGASLALFVMAVAAIILWQFKLGIDFTGGSLLEVNFKGPRPTVTEVQAKFTANNIGDLGSLVIQPIGEQGIALRFQDSTELKHRAVLKALNDLALAKSTDKKVTDLIEEVRFDSVGPSIGQELKSKAMSAVFWVFIGILFYITYSFRKVSKPVASWKYGLAALVALGHDAIITLGVFAYLGHFKGMEINTPFVAAILTVIGYSVHDTIVVFDRVRENLPKSHDDFEGTVNLSLNQTLGRSLSTSFTVLLTLLAILFWGGDSIKPFALALTIGIAIGTYSSIFVASPLLVVWEKWGKK
ncbi:MAG: protein translocase subunit SecF [bacterium]